MNDLPPRFQLARITEKGVEEVRIVRLRDVPWDTRAGRRGFLGSALTATGALGALVSGCRPAVCGGLAHSRRITSLAISRHANFMISAGGDRSLKVWSLPSGALVKTIECRGEAYYLSVSADGRFAATDGLSGNVEIYSLLDGSLIHEVASGTDESGPLALDGTGSFYANAGFDSSELYLHPLPETPGSMRVVTAGSAIHSALIAAEHGLLVCGTARELEIRRLPGGELLHRLPVNEEAVGMLALSPNGKFLASSHFNGQTRVWSLPDGALRRTLPRTVAYSGSANSLALSDTELFVGFRDGVIYSWTLTGKEKERRFASTEGEISALVVSPDGKLLASGTDDGALRVWGLSNGKSSPCLLDLECSPANVEGTTFTTRDQYGRVMTYTLPCGSPLPPGAICTCNCVPGALPVPEPEAPSVEGGGGMYCSCDLVCTCLAVPVCQAHRLLDVDPIVRRMAEQVMLLMGPREKAYFDWAAAESQPPLRARIAEVAAQILAGRPFECGDCPGREVCEAYLDHEDGVVRVMAAQLLRRLRAALSPSPATRRKVASALRDSISMHWQRTAR